MRDQYCRDCKTVESLGGDDNVKLCARHSDMEQQLANPPTSKLLDDLQSQLAESAAEVERVARKLEACEIALKQETETCESQHSIIRAEREHADRLAEKLRDCHDSLGCNNENCSMAGLLAQHAERRAAKS